MRLRRSLRPLLSIAGTMLWAVSIAVSAQSPPARPAPQTRLPAPPSSQGPPGAVTGADPREATARRLCAMCHPFEYVVAVRRTRPQWEATVENMIGRGARGTNAEFA